MKILILYTPRSGTNSIASYFLKQNTNYEYFNQPFSQYEEEGIRYATYEQCLKYDNVLVKSDISIFVRLNISVEQLLLDFDKVLLISRKNKKEQSISFIIATTRHNFLDKSKRPYFTGGINNDTTENIIKQFEGWQIMLEKYSDINIPLFYYEDLYYDNFSKLFEFLEIKYLEEDYKNILDIKNKYKTKDLEKKEIKTLV
jgi:hypothetical protein